MSKLKGAIDGVPFTKNDPRINREGRPPKLPSLDELLAETLGSDNAMLRILNAIIKKAQKGDVRCAELLMDRGYGKLVTKQSIEMTLDGLSPEEILIIQNFRIKNDETNG